MRSRRLSRVLAVALTGLSLIALPACGDRDDRREEVLKVVRNSRRLPGRFIYVDQRDSRKAIVKGIVEDDFRIKARVSVNDVDAYEQVVYDDKLAMRFLEPKYLHDLVNPTKADADASTDIPGITVTEALAAKRWVVAPTGAPYFTAPAEGESALGRDPLLDAVTALDYVESSIRKAQTVEKWNPDDVTPTYSSSEDNFPKPEDGSGVTRYDLARPDLPPPSLASSGQRETSTPKSQHVRKMAIYVKDNRIIQVREAIELRGKFLDDFRDYYLRLLDEAETPEKLRNQVKKALDEAPPAQLATILQLSLNGFLVGIGEPIIPFRTMNLELIGLGQATEISLPEGEVVSGKLDFLITSDVGKLEEGGNTREAVFSGEGGPGILKPINPAFFAGGPGAGGSGSGAGGGGGDQGGGQHTTTTTAPPADGASGTEPAAGDTPTSSPAGSPGGPGSSSRRCASR